VQWAPCPTMRATLRKDESAVASTVATVFVFLVVLLFLAAAMVAVIPQKQYEAEFATAQEALEAFERLRAFSAGPGVAGGRFSVVLPLGTHAVSPFGADSPGVLRFEESVATGVNVSMRFVPHFNQGRVTRVVQDVILLMDSSGSMGVNDPGRLRISGAKEYVGRLAYPDRVAIVDFDGDAVFTRVNVGGFPHLLGQGGHDGIPDYADPQADLDTIDQSGSTNFGDAIRIANDEFVARGNPAHAYVMILLTDGQNNFAWQDTLALTEASRARANGIAIYTIGLGRDPDAALLRAIATTTGGTYYAAPNAASIRWIYFEISRRYQGSFVCGQLDAQDAAFGSLSLSLGAREYPEQSLLLEGSSIVLGQTSGAAIRQGLPLEYAPSGPGTGVLSLTTVTFLGSSHIATGVEPVFVEAKILTRDSQRQALVRPHLDDEASGISNISAEVQSWTDQGAATQAAADAVIAELDAAEGSVLAGFANESAGLHADAKFDLDRAQARLSAAIAAADDQADRGAMQRWLAVAITDEVLVAACRLDQWRNWYEGVTLDLRSSVPGAWAIWFNDVLTRVGADFSMGQSGDRVIVSVHAVSSFVLDRRVVELSFG